MDKKEIEERLKKLEEENQEIKKQNQKLKQIIQNKVGRSGNRSKSSSDGKVSRREFLKKLGAGAIGLGALATPVASKMTISSNGVYRDGGKAFMDLSGSNVMTGNLDLDQNSLVGVGGIGNNGSAVSVNDNLDLQGGQSIQNVKDLTTAQAEITGPNRNMQLLHEDGVESTSTPVSVSPTGNDDLYALTYQLQTDSDGGGYVRVTLNGDNSSGNGNYYYYDESGGKVTGQDYVELISSSNSYMQAGGIIWINDIYDDSGGSEKYIGMGHSIQGGRISRISSYTDTASYQSTVSFSSLRFDMSSTIHIEADLWRVISR